MIISAFWFTNILKNDIILISQVEHTSVKWSDAVGPIVMSLRPLIKINLIPKYLWIQQLENRDASFHQLDKSLTKHERGSVVVLILHNVVNHILDGTYLIIYKGVVDRRSIVIVFSIVWFSYFVLIEDGVFLLEVSFVFGFIQEHFHWSAIKGQDRTHVIEIKF